MEAVFVFGGLLIGPSLALLGTAAFLGRGMADRVWKWGLRWLHLGTILFSIFGISRLTEADDDIASVPLTGMLFFLALLSGALSWLTALMVTGRAIDQRSAAEIIGRRRR